MSETVKPFTEDQRNRLTFAVENHAPNWADKDNLAGLLARLAAAERLAEGVRNDSRMHAIYLLEIREWLATRGIGV